MPSRAIFGIRPPSNGRCRIPHAVIHCAAALPLSSPAEIISTGVDGRAFCSKERSKAALLALSTSLLLTAVYGIPDHHPLREEDKLCGVGPYGESKIEAEDCACNFEARDCVYQSCGRNLLWARSVLGSLNCYTNGHMTARIFPCWGRAAIAISSWTLPIFAKSLLGA